MKINRSDNSFISVQDFANNNSKVIFGFAGYAYNLYCPLLYYVRNIASQHNFDYFGIDFGYSNNELFKEKTDEEKEKYFENDIILVEEFIKTKNYKQRVFLGKSLGTTVINRLMENKIISNKDCLIYLTPGNDWNKIINNLSSSSYNTLIVGSRTDQDFIKYDYSRLLMNVSIEILEFENENHVLETGNIKNDLNVLAKVMNEVEVFIQKCV